MAHKTSNGSASVVLLDKAAKLLYLAAGISVLMTIVALFLPRGMAAIEAIGGIPSGPVPQDTARWALLLDTLFPMFYGGGLAVFFASFRARGNGPLIRLILGAILFAIAADFLENGLAYPVMTGAGEPLAFQFSVTVIKFGLLTFAAVMGAAVLPDAANGFERLAKLLLRYLFPVSIAVLLSGIGGEIVRNITGLGFTISLVILGVYAQNMKRRHQG